MSIKFFGLVVLLVPTIYCGGRKDASGGLVVGGMMMKAGESTVDGVGDWSFWRPAFGFDDQKSNSEASLKI